MSNRPRNRRLPDPRDYVLPTEAIPGGPIVMDLSDVPLADVMTVRPGRSDEWPENVTAIAIDFQQMTDGTPNDVARVLFVGTAEHMRAMGHIFATAATMAADLCPKE